MATGRADFWGLSVSASASAVLGAAAHAWARSLQSVLPIAVLGLLAVTCVPIVASALLGRAGKTVSSRGLVFAVVGSPLGFAAAVALTSVAAAL